MKRSEMARLLAQRHGMSLSKAEEVIAAIGGAIIDHLASGGRVELRNFGNFEVRAYAARYRRNPKSGEVLTALPAKRARFKASPKLLQRLNGDGGSETQLS